MRKSRVGLAAGGTSPDANIQPTFPRQVQLPQQYFTSNLSYSAMDTIRSFTCHIFNQTANHKKYFKPLSYHQPFQPDPQDKFILIIDDSQTVRKIVEACLHRKNFKV